MSRNTENRAGSTESTQTSPLRGRLRRVGRGAYVAASEISNVAMLGFAGVMAKSAYEAGDLKMKIVEGAGAVALATFAIVYRVAGLLERRNLRRELAQREEKVRTWYDQRVDIKGAADQLAESTGVASITDLDLGSMWRRDITPDPAMDPRSLEGRMLRLADDDLPDEVKRRQSRR